MSLLNLFLRIILMLLLQSKALQVYHGKQKLNSETCVQYICAPNTIRFKHVSLSYYVQYTDASVPASEYHWCTNVLDTSNIQIKPTDVPLLTKGPMSCPLQQITREVNNIAHHLCKQAYSVGLQLLFAKSLYNQKMPASPFSFSNLLKLILYVSFSTILNSRCFCFYF